MKNFLIRFGGNESGATSIEYGLIAALIAIGIITAATSVGTEVSGTFDDVATGLAAR